MTQNESSAPSQFKVELADINWTQFNWRLGSRRVPGIIIPLLAAVIFHQVPAGVLAAGTALSVGFAGSRHLGGSRLVAMIATVALMAVCAFAGTLAGNYYAAALAGAVAGGLICGLLALASEMRDGWRCRE